MVIIIPPPGAIFTAIVWSPIILLGLVLAVGIVMAPVSSLFDWASSRPISHPEGEPMDRATRWEVEGK